MNKKTWKDKSRLKYEASPMEFVGFKLKREYDLTANGNYPCTPKEMHRLIKDELRNGRDS